MQTMTPTNPYSGPAELLSALADGESNAHFALHDLQHDLLHAQWNVYHTIGDVLKTPQSGPPVALGADPAFLQRLLLRLQEEKIEEPQLAPALVVVTQPNTASANDGAFRWKLATGLASFGLAAVVAFNLTKLPVSKLEPQLSQGLSATELVVTSPLGLMVRDARLEELLAAHKQLGGTALQAPSGFLRNAGIESAPGSQR